MNNIFFIKKDGAILEFEEIEVVQNIKSNYFSGEELVKNKEYTHNHWKKLRTLDIYKVNSPNFDPNDLHKDKELFEKEEDKLIDEASEDITGNFKPRSLSQILDFSFSFFKKHFLKCFLIVAIIQVSLFIIIRVLLYSFIGSISISSSYMKELSSANYWNIGIGYILFTAFSIFGNSLSIATLSIYVQRKLFGKELSIGEVYGLAMKRIWKLILTALLVFFVIGIGFMLFLVPGIIWSFMFALVSVVVVLENKGGSKAMQRSADLMKMHEGKKGSQKNYNKVFLIFLVYYGISVAASMLITIPAKFLELSLGISKYVSQGTQAGIMKAQLFQLPFDLLQTLVTSAFFPIVYIALIILYYDIRIRHTGFDLYVQSKKFK
ncbi:hypothetical protein J7L48_00095 [bacterium]|nr:hypothetical protein [bacterium]